MRCLIIDDAGTLTMEDGAQIVMILKDPATMPAIAVYPKGANVGAWHSIHDEAMARRKSQLMDNEQRTVTDR